MSRGITVRVAMKLQVVLWGALMIAIGFSVVTAQTTRLGIKGGYLHVNNLSSMPVILGSTDCGVFENGTSAGFFGGVTIDYAVAGDALELSGAILFAQRPAQLTARRTDDYMVLDPRNSRYVYLQREHVFTSTPGYISFELGVRSRPLSAVPIYLRSCVDAGNPLVDATYTQTEEIVAPSGVLFPDGTKRRTTGSGEFPGFGTSIGVYGGLGAVLALSDQVELCPEVGYRYGLNSLSSRTEWRQSWIAAGIQVRVQLGGQEEIIVPPPPPPPAPEPPVVVAVVPVATMASIASAPVQFQETLVTQTYPLLPYVFFDSASADIPGRYVAAAERDGFSERNIPKSTLPIYYRILDIIGARMSASPAMRLVVTGTTDGKERATASDRQQLARARAEAVVQRIADRWGLDRGRFDVVVRNKPRQLSNEEYEDGIVENRRVELSSTSSEVLGPVVHTRFYEYVPTQPRHDIAIRVASPNSVNAWQVVVRQRGGEPLTTFSGEGAPPDRLSFILDQQMTDRIGPQVVGTDSLLAELQLKLKTEEAMYATATTFPLVKTTSTFEVSRLSLIVFEYDESAISKENEAMMRSVIAKATGAGSAARVIGSTDRLGELDHNMALSQQRAESVERLAKAIAPTLRIEEVRGIGPGKLEYDNLLPEGRFYCRTVSLTITTPIQ